jgi:aminoglycoside 6-adenylyltransferase
LTSSHEPSDVLRRLVRWADRKDPIRAVLLTSTRARPHAPVDALSDYDAVLVVEEILPFFEDRSWLGDFGEVLVAYWDGIERDPDHGVGQTANVVQYVDGLKIDFRLWPVDLLQRIAVAPKLPDELGAGYAVLQDKDSLAAGLRPPTHKAYVPDAPDEEAFLTWVNDFFSDAPYVAKCLLRDELFPAKWNLDYDMKHVYLRRMLEWRMECDRGWSEPTDWLGKGLKKQLPPEIWEELEGTYAGADPEENWEALLRTMALFRRVGLEVAEDLGYAYPRDLDRRVAAYVRSMRHSDLGAAGSQERKGATASRTPSENGP